MTRIPRRSIAARFEARIGLRGNPSCFHAFKPPSSTHTPEIFFFLKSESYSSAGEFASRRTVENDIQTLRNLDVSRNTKALCIHSDGSRGC
jgi:hypothetical protein